MYVIALVTLMFVSIPAGRDLKFHELCSGVNELGDVGVICWVFLCVYWWVRIIPYVICAVARALRCESELVSLFGPPKWRVLYVTRVHTSSIQKEVY